MPGFFSNTLAVLRREIHRVARQPMYWLLTVILPIVAFAFFAVLLYKGVARDIPIAVVDQDNSTLSRKVTQMIDATPTAWVAYGVQGMEEAERLMLQGKVMGIVLIPDFFESSFPKKVVVTRAGIFRNVMGLIAKVLKQKEGSIPLSFMFQ